MLTAGCYARKSTDEGDKAAEAKSCARQIARAKEDAATRGWRFDERYVFSDDGVSGAEFRNRPSLNALLTAVKEKHRLNVLIVSEQSRHDQRLYGPCRKGGRLHRRTDAVTPAVRS
jgi:DNA invertase Pin-like site-specific DNA recombinase